MVRLFGTPKLVSVELFKVKNTLKHGRFSKFLKVTTKTEGHGKLEKLMEKIRVSPGIWRALNGTNSVKYFQFWENVIRKRKKSRTCFPAKTLSLTCKESYSNSKTQVMQWRIQGKPPPPYCYPKLRQLETDPTPATPPPPLISGSGWPGPSLIWRFGYATVMWKLLVIRFLCFACAQK